MHDPMDLILGGSIVQAVLPVDFDNTTQNGLWANMANVECVTMICVLAAPADAGTGPVISLSQAQDASGTGAKALEITEAWYLKAADLSAINQATELWTEVECSRTSPIADWDADSVGADIAEFMFVARVHQQNLDSNGGYTHVRMNAVQGNTTLARLGHMIYVAKDRKYSGEPKPGLLN